MCALPCSCFCLIRFQFPPPPLVLPATGFLLLTTHAPNSTPFPGIFIPPFQAPLAGAPASSLPRRTRARADDAASEGSAGDEAPDEGDGGPPGDEMAPLPARPVASRAGAHEAVALDELIEAPEPKLARHARMPARERQLRPNAPLLSLPSPTHECTYSITTPSHTSIQQQRPRLQWPFTQPPLPWCMLTLPPCSPRRAPGAFPARRDARGRRAPLSRSATSQSSHGAA